MKCVDVLAYGARVEVGPASDPIEATINQVCIKGETAAVDYEVVWWAGNERKSAWVAAAEVRTSSTRRVRAGFVYNGQCAMNSN